MLYPLELRYRSWERYDAPYEALYKAYTGTQTKVYTRHSRSWRRLPSLQRYTSTRGVHQLYQVSDSAEASASPIEDDNAGAPVSREFSVPWWRGAELPGGPEAHRNLLSASQEATRVLIPSGSVSRCEKPHPFKEG